MRRVLVMAAGHLMSESTCQHCGSGINLVQSHPLGTGPLWVHTASGSTRCSLFAVPALPTVLIPTPPPPVTVAFGNWVDPWPDPKPPPDRSWIKTRRWFRWFGGSE